MKLLIASDLHGSAYYCEKLLHAFQEEHAKRMLLLGDLLYHGPRNDLPRAYDPKAVLTLLNEQKTSLFCVRGNCDTEVDQMVLEFPILADYGVLLLGKRLAYVSHGHKYVPGNLPLKAGDIFIQGHTHVPMCRKHEGVFWLNPGSVSIPKENSHHQYMIYENGVFVWKDFAGNTLHVLKIEE
ncbi:MAG: phosphodiesterase [Lachnospiraceae bacterium]|nr:phosphodiesterase [Lachnospiraceae bacterium]